MAIQWRDEMAVDHDIIDDDHQTLIKIINMFCAATPNSANHSELRAIFDKLDHYSKVHFSREETLQRAAQYPYHEAHHHEHVDLIHTLADFGKQLDGLASVPSNPMCEAQAGEQEKSPEPEKPMKNVAVIHAEIEVFLHHWLVDHIIKSDLRMKPYAAQMAPHALRMEPLKL